MADIATLQNLKDAAAGTLAGGPDYTIAPITFTLDADLTFTAAVTITHDGTAGDTTITGNNLYDIRIAAVDNTLIGLSASQRIIITNTDTHAYYVTSVGAGGVNATLTYCQVKEAQTNNGITLVGGPISGPVVITCNDCELNNNANDGASLLTGATGFPARIVLNNCNSHNNDPLEVGGGAGDGATAHEPNHTVVINGGTYHSNSKSGVMVVGGATVLAYNWPDFYGNSDASENNAAQVAVVGDATNRSTGIFTNCNIRVDGTETVNDEPLAWCDDGHIELVDCILDGNGTMTTEVITFEETNRPVTFKIDGCLFKNMPASDEIIKANGLTTLSGTISNCTTDGGYRFLDYSSIDVTMYNNIFQGFTNNAIVCRVDDTYTNNPLNDYNCFWDNTSDFFQNDSGVNANDLEVNPQLDANDKPTNSEVINGGKPDANGDDTSIGAIGATATAGGYRSRYSG